MLTEVLLLPISFSEKRKALCLKRYPLSAFRKRYSAVEMFLSTSVHQGEKRLLA